MNSIDNITKEKRRGGNILSSALENPVERMEMGKIAISGLLFAIGLALRLPEWIESILFYASYLIVGAEILWRAFKNILKGQVFDENFLMTIATLGAFAIGELPEGVAVMLFYQVGELFQDMAVKHSRNSITELMDIRPDYVNLKDGDGSIKVPPGEVPVGALILVKPGEKIPLDGKIILGSSMLDTSALTGESVPKDVETGDEVLGGCVNLSGLLTVEVTKVYGESTVSKILKLVQSSSLKKAPTENFITTFAGYYTPVVVVTALVIALIPPMVLPGQSFSDWVYRSFIFLVISCPCALVVSIPLGFFGGIGAASKKGILVKGGNYLEALNHLETVIFDKTGTLTKGVFRVTGLNPIVPFSEDELLESAAYAEYHSNHPIALSILKAYGKAVDPSAIESYEELSGHGARVFINGQEILVGNKRFMEKENIPSDLVDAIGTVVYVARDRRIIGHVVISDEIREDSFDVVKALKVLGIKKTVMLTGDVEATGAAVGNALRLDEVYSGLLPADKVEKLEWLDGRKSSKGKLAYLGDGINDAPVLARADIGIAMGGLGSDAAIEAADIVIMTDEPSKLVTAIKIARRTRTIVVQNIVFALGIKFFFLGMGALGMATMWQAVFADVGVAVLAVLNAMRAMKS